MTYKKIAAGRQKVPEAVNQSLLSGPVKINHHVAAENDVK